MEYTWNGSQVEKKIIHDFCVDLNLVNFDFLPLVELLAKRLVPKHLLSKGTTKSVQKPFIIDILKLY